MALVQPHVLPLLSFTHANGPDIALFLARPYARPAREVARGAFAPVLTNAGLPLVDGAAAFSWVHLEPNTQPHPMQNIGEYMRCVHAHRAGSGGVRRPVGQVLHATIATRRSSPQTAASQRSLPGPAGPSASKSGSGCVPQSHSPLPHGALLQRRPCPGLPRPCCRHIRLVSEFEASLASGCEGANCPCLDAPEDPGRRCTRLGDRLADLPPGKSDYTKRWGCCWNVFPNDKWGC